MANNRKRTAAVTEPVAAVAVNETKEVETVVTPPVVEKVKEAHTFQQDDLIECRSVTEGTLLLPAKKTGTLYRWSGYGDVTEVTYQDLYSLMIAKSGYLYDPLFVVDDEELLEDPKWKSLKALYDSMYTKEDVKSVLALPAGQFERVLKQLPKGLLNAVKISVSTGIEDGTFDSIKKIEIVDKVCGTDFKNTL